jgi:hypothetical protein
MQQKGICKQGRTLYQAERRKTDLQIAEGQFLHVKGKEMFGVNLRSDTTVRPGMGKNLTPHLINSLT